MSPEVKISFNTSLTFIVLNAVNSESKYGIDGKEYPTLFIISIALNNMSERLSVLVNSISFDFDF